MISIVAPPGYGKTSLLAQWATESSGPVAWLTADDSDSDPVVLLTDLAAAIDRVEPLGTEIFVAIASAAVSNRAVVGRLLAAMSRPSEAVRIAIDDGYRITSRSGLDILAELIANLPEGSQVAIAGRERMRLPFVRWRAEGSLLELGPAELAMDELEAAGLGRELGLRLSPEATTSLTRRTDGWPALLALATLGARSPMKVAGRLMRDADRPIDDYLRSEVLERPLRDRDRISDSHLDRRAAVRAALRCHRRGAGIDLAPAATCTVDPPGGRLRWCVSLPHAPARLPPARARGPRARDGCPPSIGEQPRGTTRTMPSSLPSITRSQRATSTSPPRWSATPGSSSIGPAVERRSGLGHRVSDAEALEARPWLAVLAAWEELAAGDVAGTVRFAEYRRAWDVRGQATRRHGLLRSGAGDAPGRHGPARRRRCAGKRHPGG